MTLIYELT